MKLKSELIKINDTEHILHQLSQKSRISFIIRHPDAVIATIIDADFRLFPHRFHSLYQLLCRRYLGLCRLFSALAKAISKRCLSRLKLSKVAAAICDLINCSAAATCELIDCSATATFTQRLYSLRCSARSLQDFTKLVEANLNVSPCRKRAVAEHPALLLVLTGD